ncbi:helix-turn-helix domain-containing protein [Actinomycetota bacterium Odt1-20B]
MGRLEYSIATPNPALEKLADWLRLQRRAAGLTYRDMASKSGHAFSATTYSRATTGTRMPRLPVVEAYAKACGAPVDRARRLWQAARYAEHRKKRPRAGVPRPDTVYDRAELVHALKELYYKAGAMPVDEMERRAGKHGQLPHSTVLRMLAGKSMLTSAQLTAFLRVCGVTSGIEHEQWRQAWLRARRRQAVEHDADIRLLQLQKPLGRSRPLPTPGYPSLESSAYGYGPLQPVALAMPVNQAAGARRGQRPSSP